LIFSKKFFNIYQKEEEIEKIEDVIFLGAGASASEGAPVQGALFKEYFRLYKDGEIPYTNSEINTRLVKFFNAFFGINVNQRKVENISFPSFEEILGILELSINRQESFRDYSFSPAKPLIQQIREDLIFLIAIVLDKKLETTPQYHEILVNRLKKEKRLSKTCFISLNYDILIDNALIKLFPEYHVDYGVEFTNFERKIESVKYWERPDPKKSIFLLKLHGSLNWLYCPTCISLTLTPLEKRVAKLVFEPQYCDMCGGEMIPIIIPPTFFKVMSNFFLQKIWRKAESVLTRARRIFFCGYSFPDADVHIKYLLKRTEINKGSTPEIFIINNHEGKPLYQKEEEEWRYKRFFKEKEKVHYTSYSFQEFCEQGINT